MIYNWIQIHGVFPFLIVYWCKYDNQINPNLTAYDQVGLVYKPGSTRLAGLERLTDAENASESKG